MTVGENGSMGRGITLTKVVSLLCFSFMAYFVVIVSLLGVQFYCRFYVLPWGEILLLFLLLLLYLNQSLGVFCGGKISLIDTKVIIMIEIVYCNKELIGTYIKINRNLA